MATRRSKDFKFYYTTDRNDIVISVQRTYKTSNDILLTPLTSLFYAVEYKSPYKTEPTRRKDRKVSVCIINQETQTGISEVSATIPYSPIDANHNNHIKEIVALPEVKRIEYFSEGRD